MQTKNLLSSLIFCLLAMPCLSQQSTDEALRLVLQQIHNRLLVDEKEAVQELTDLIGKWKSMDVPYNQKRSFLLGAADYYTMQGFGTKGARKSVKKQLPRLYPAYEDKDLEIVKKSADMVDLINEKLIHLHESFPLNDKALLHEEFGEYRLRDGMKIGEIGAGSGLASILIACLYDDLELYVNELGHNRIKYLTGKISKFPEIRKSNKIYPLKGSRKSTNLENKELDLIFMRETFHHFKYPEAMLLSIHRSLKADGTVIVAEEILDYEVDDSKCSKALKKAAVMSLFEKGGFKCVQGFESGTQYIFTFQKR